MRNIFEPIDFIPGYGAYRVDQKLKRARKGEEHIDLGKNYDRNWNLFELYQAGTCYLIIAVPLAAAMHSLL